MNWLRNLSRLRGCTPRSATDPWPIRQTLPQDVFITGYPKSGNTWVQNLLAGALWGADPALAPDAVVQQLVPDVHYLTHYARLGPVMAFKSHSLPEARYRKVVYLVRDVRDVMVSYYHHINALSRSPVSFDAIVRQGVGLTHGRWHEHVDAWHANPFHAQLIVVRYEDLKRDSAHELGRILEFAGVACQEQTLRWAAERSSFANLRQKEERSGYHGDWPKDKRFIRRGEVGSFKQEMPPEVLAQLMLQAGATLQRFYPSTQEVRIAA